MNLVVLPEPEYSTSPEMALNRALEADLESVIICGYTKDGYFRTFNARMSNADAYFALAQGQDHIMGR